MQTPMPPSFLELTDVRRRSFRHRAQAFVWENNRPFRALAHRFRRSASLAIYSIRSRLGADFPPRVVPIPASSTTAALAHPAIAVATGAGGTHETISRFLSSQTESLVTTYPKNESNPEFVYFVGEGCCEFPPTYLESLLMAACAEDLDWAIGGWGEPAPGRFGPSGHIALEPGVDPGSGLLVRLPHAARAQRRDVCGRAVPHLCDSRRFRNLVARSESFTEPSGAYRLRHGIGPGTLVRSPVDDVAAALGELPEVSGPPTALFLLPYLAVGGAETLLKNLIHGLCDRRRVIIATTDPHLSSLGQSVDSFRELTPYVYTLGDWLPQEAISSALCHLLRRWRVESLVCWNGSVFFYDHVGAIKRRFPSIRIINQLYNHEGGWIEHYCPSLVGPTDLHIAVNTPIARALVEERAVPADSITTIHHGVEVPDEPSTEQKARLRRRCRERLGLPVDTILVGTFIRMHPQKRPLDVIRIARELAKEDVHFLLVGGGPLDVQIDDELRKKPLSNLTRLPLTDDALPLYDAIDICLLTSSFEGLPVFLLDGLARSIPCVAPGVGDIPLLLEKGGGVVVDRPGDIDGLASGIRKLMEPERRRHEGSRGRAQVQSRFGIERFVSDYEDAIFPKQ